MQTFVPHPDFHSSLSCLDRTRLGNQVYREGLTLLRGGWKNHPASRMWLNYRGKDYRYALCSYLLAGVDVLDSRDLVYPHIRAEILKCRENHSDIGSPPWIGDEKVHASHRSHLLLKGRVDAAFRTLRLHAKPQSVADWLKINGYPSKHAFKQDHIRALESFLSLNGLNGKDANWYLRFGWSDSDDLEYVWPT